MAVWKEDRKVDTTAERAVVAKVKRTVELEAAMMVGLTVVSMESLASSWVEWMDKSLCLVPQMAY